MKILSIKDLALYDITTSLFKNGTVLTFQFSHRCTGPITCHLWSGYWVHPPGQCPVHWYWEPTRGLSQQWNWLT